MAAKPHCSHPSHTQTRSHTPPLPLNGSPRVFNLHNNARGGKQLYTLTDDTKGVVGVSEGFFLCVCFYWVVPSQIVKPVNLSITEIGQSVRQLVSKSAGLSVSHPVSIAFLICALILPLSSSSLPPHRWLICHRTDWQNKPLFLVVASHLVARGIAFITSVAYKCDWGSHTSGGLSTLL